MINYKYRDHVKKGTMRPETTPNCKTGDLTLVTILEYKIGIAAISRRNET